MLKRSITLILPILMLLAAALPAQAAEQWPPDARDVAFAIAAKATGQEGLANVTFSPEAEAGVEGAANGFYASFEAGKIVLVTYTNHGTGTAYDADVAGVINLLERSGRIVALQFAAKYSVNGSSIRINECAAVTASPATVHLEVHLVPMDTFLNIPYDVVSDWTALHKLAKENAYLPPKEDAPAGNYMVMTFVMNRIPPNAEFEAIVSDRKTARRSRDNAAKSQERYMDYKGWRVHMFAAKFSPTSVRDHFYINYNYTPGSGVPESERDKIQVARYDSKPSGERLVKSAPKPMVVEEAPAPKPAPAPKQATQGYMDPSVTSEQAPAAQPYRAPAQAQQPPAQQPYRTEPPKAAPAPAPAPQPAVGPLERGLAFLNPVFPDDVELIQQRLKELGIYKGPIDKNFGPQTKRALDHYAVGQGYPKGQWSLGLQKALFTGTGL